MRKAISILTAAFAVSLSVSGAEPAAGSGILIGDEFTILADGPGKGTQATPAAAYGLAPGASETEGVYLVVWREGSAAEGGGARIMACRVSAAGGVLDAKGIVVAPNSAKDAPQLFPRAAFCRNSFLVVWQDFRNGKDNDVLAARISLEGRVLDPEPIRVAAGPGTQANPDVASNGDGFLAVYQKHPDSTAPGKYSSCAAPVTIEGQVGSASEVADFSPCPRVASNGTNYMFAAGSTIGLTYVKCRLIGPDGKPLKGEQLVYSNCRSPELALAAEPGKGWLVANHRVRPDFWGWGGPAAQRFLNFTTDLKPSQGWPPRNDYPKSRDGEPNWLDGKQVDGKSLGTPYGPNACAWDGRCFVVAWQRFRQGNRGFSVVLDRCDIIVGRVDGWNPVDGPNGVPLAGSELEETWPALASDGAGNLLCAYEQTSKDGAKIIRAKMLHTLESAFAGRRPE